ncbi:MAG TPA: glycosyltransferase [Patescibacteria group bacterium]|nr:glycosyltransferase [Patescibacteria group bacterium]
MNQEINTIDLKFSILIPTFNGSAVIKDTLRSILTQSFQNFEIIIQDDVSSDNTVEVINSLNDPRIKIFKNEKNLGYSKNLDSLSRKATGEIIYLMGQDDILAQGALMDTYNAFKSSPDIGGVARPYYWFHKNIDIPVRATKQLNPQKDEIVRITDDFNRIILLIDVAGQLSGLAYRRKFIDRPFHDDIFPCHVYPFASILKKHPIVFLKDYNLAVRIASSQCRSVSSIYNVSPLKSWVDFFNNVFNEKEFINLRNYCIKNYVAVNYVGLVQIKNYAKYRYLLREIWYLLKYRWENLFSLKFWFFSLGCVVMPASLLIPMVDWYKNNINSKKLKYIKIKYNLNFNETTDKQAA